MIAMVVYKKTTKQNDKKLGLGCATTNSGYVHVHVCVIRRN